MGTKKKGLNWLENSATALWLVMDILWSYDLVFIAAFVGLTSALLQFIHIHTQTEKIARFESIASFFWIGANTLWLVEADIMKTIYFVLALITTVKVIQLHGRLKRGT